MELKKNETKEWWNKIADLEKKSIELGLSDAEKMKLKPHPEAERIYGKWL